MTQPESKPRLARNDLRQYDELADDWWRADGPFAALHWLASARGRLVPEPRPGDVAVDLGCGGGLMRPHLRGYRHVGIDRSPTAAAVAARRGVHAVRAAVEHVPLPDACADVVVAGEILEHVDDPTSVVHEIARILRPGGVALFDTINDTWLARVALVGIAERLPGGPPPRIHDPELFVRPAVVREAFACHGISTELWGLRPSAVDYLRFLADRRRPVQMIPTRSLALVYQGTARKPSS